METSALLNQCFKCAAWPLNGGEDKWKHCKISPLLYRMVTRAKHAVVSWEIPTYPWQQIYFRNALFRVTENL
jgi:hypothetical protein